MDANINHLLKLANNIVIYKKYLLRCCYYESCISLDSVTVYLFQFHEIFNLHLNYHSQQKSATA